MMFSNGKHLVPHMEYKAKVDEYIKSQLQELAQKTTFLWTGWYPSNMVFMPLIKPFEVVSEAMSFLTLTYLFVSRFFVLWTLRCGCYSLSEVRDWGLMELVRLI